MQSIRKQFETWASCYYSGFEGGNLGAPYWFCGIEYGGNFDFEKISRLDVGDNASYEKSQDIKDNKIPYWDKNHNKKFRFAEKVAKVVCLLQEKGEIDTWRIYQKNLFTKDGDVFKMNLFPINFYKDNDKLWVDEYKKRLGFNTKKEYRDWCKKNRLPFLQNLVIENKPPLLICTGISHKHYYTYAFLEKQTVLREHKIDKYICYSSIRKDTGTVVIITPFFGLGGIMTNQGYVDLSNVIKKILDKRGQIYL